MQSDLHAMSALPTVAPPAAVATHGDTDTAALPPAPTKKARLGHTGKLRIPPPALEAEFDEEANLPFVMTPGKHGKLRKRFGEWSDNAAANGLACGWSLP